MKLKTKIMISHILVSFVCVLFFTVTLFYWLFNVLEAQGLPFTTDMLKPFIVTLLMTLLFILIMAMFFSSWSVKPLLKRLTMFTDGIRNRHNENFNEKIAEAGDEFSELTGAFNEFSLELSTMLKSRDELLKERDALKQTENRFSQLIELAPDAIVVTDKNGQIVLLNRMVEQLFGYTKSELLHQQVEVLIPKHLREHHVSQRQKYVDHPRERLMSSDLDFKAMHKDGKIFDVDISLSPIQGDQETFYVGSIRDMTRQKQMIYKLRNEREKALESARAKSYFLANMSHEIRTPMNSILGFSDLISKTALNSKQKDYINTIKSSGNLLLGIIDDILDISKLESGKITLEWTVFHLENLIIDVFKMIVTRMKDKPFDTYIEINEDVPENIKGDPTRLKQILVNLLGNAVKFTSSGSIGIIVEIDKQNKCLQFHVKDTGIGISKKKLSTIFESFTQADESTTRRFGGTGLGLAISKSLVEAMGGDIMVKSEENKGSEFIFSLPLLDISPSELNRNHSYQDERFFSKSVFIVDDNQISRRIINKCCETMGFRVLGAADSAQSALHKLDKALNTKGLVPDLMLCDIMMEGMNGFELVNKVKNHKSYQSTKFVAVTADLKAETSSQAKASAFDSYVTKPVNLKDLFKAITQVFDSSVEDEPSKDSRAHEQKPCEGVKILIVEDAAPNRMLMEVYVAELGCQAEFAINGLEAIESLKKNDYHLVLMDLHMPIMGGFEATEVIRKELHQTLPVIALSASVLREDREQAQKVGMTDFLTKPINLEKLKTKILQYARSLN